MGGLSRDDWARKQYREDSANVICGFFRGRDEQSSLPSTSFDILTALRFEGVLPQSWNSFSTYPPNCICRDSTYYPIGRTKMSIEMFLDSPDYPGDQPKYSHLPSNLQFIYLYYSWVSVIGPVVQFTRFWAVIWLHTGDLYFPTPNPIFDWDQFIFMHIMHIDRQLSLFLAFSACKTAFTIVKVWKGWVDRSGT